MSAPLAHLRVLDLSRVLAGPYCTQQLADLGADVIKVEPPGGDDTRRFGPPFVGGESTYFLSINRGKRSICLDLKQAEGVDIVRGLAAWADVVVENFRPGVADRLGVGYGDLSADHPGLIYASISGYGTRGIEPYTTLPGYDLVIQGVGGIPSLTGPGDGPPYKMGTSVADLVSGQNALAGILAALVARAQTGRGTHLDISMQDGQLSLLTYHAAAWLNADQAPARLGNAHPSICPYETFAASDGYLNLACGNDNLFKRLCQALGLPELADDPRFTINRDRVAARDDLLEILEPKLREAPVAVWLERLGEAGIPCGPIHDVPAALAHPQVHARGTIVRTQHPTSGPIRTVGAPLGFPSPTYTERPPPRLGEHGPELLGEILELDGDQTARLLETGVVIVPEPA